MSTSKYMIWWKAEKEDEINKKESACRRVVYSAANDSALLVLYKIWWCTLHLIKIDTDYVISLWRLKTLTGSKWDHNSQKLYIPKYMKKRRAIVILTEQCWSKKSDRGHFCPLSKDILHPVDLNIFNG